MLSVAHNLTAMNAQRQFDIGFKSKAKSSEKLSSGYKINRAADDAAGLAISEKMRRQVRGLTQASANCQDGISLVQIADGAMAEIHDMLDRCTELSVKAANGTLTNIDRGYIQAEIDQIKEEIDAIKEKTTFNELPILQGEDIVATPTSGGAFLVGGLPSWVNGGSSLSDHKLEETVAVSGNTYLGATLDFSGLNDSDPAVVKGRLKELAQSDSGFNMTCCTCDEHYSVKFVEGPAGKRIGSEHKVYEVSVDGINDASELVNRIKSTIVSGGKVGGHLLSCATDGNSLQIYDSRYTSRTGISDSRGTIAPGVAYSAKDLPQGNHFDIYIQADAEPSRHIDIVLPSVSCKSLKILTASVRTEKDADAAIEAFKMAKSYVSEERSRMGSYQNRLEHTVENLDNDVENTAAAESRIRDTDMAKEMVAYSVRSILEQVGQSMISQANQNNQGVMALLQ